MKHKPGCICEHCCAAVDDIDDRMMAQIYEGAKLMGQPIFDQIQVRDRINWYNIPPEYQHLAPGRNFEQIQQVARWKVSGVVVHKHDTEAMAFLEVRIDTGHIIKIGQAECVLWAVHVEPNWEKADKMQFNCTNPNGCHCRPNEKLIATFRCPYFLAANNDELRAKQLGMTLGQYRGEEPLRIIKVSKDE